MCETRQLFCSSNTGSISDPCRQAVTIPSGPLIDINWIMPISVKQRKEASKWVLKWPRVVDGTRFCGLVRTDFQPVLQVESNATSPRCGQSKDQRFRVRVFLRVECQFRTKSACGWGCTRHALIRSVPWNRAWTSRSLSRKPEHETADPLLHARLFNPALRHSRPLVRVNG